MKTETAIERAKIAEYHYGLDLEKDYFVLEADEIQLLGLCYRATGYNGRNNLKRSKYSQFWHYLQEAWKKFQEKTKGAQ